MESCPACGKPYGQRRRCYFCHGKPRTGEERTCAICGRRFYVALWQMADTRRRQGTYCSRACKAEGHRRQVMPLSERKPYINRQGYVMVAVASGRRQDNYRAEHRLIMEAHLGRPLTRFEHVHHINGDRADNRLENLLLLSNREHQKLHDFPQTHRGERVARICRNCGTAYEVKPHKAATSTCCSVACRLDVQHAATRAYWAAKRAEAKA